MRTLVHPFSASTGALPWPLPALLGWGAAWAVQALLAQALGHGSGGAVLAAWLGASAAGGAAALLCARPWRRAIVALGFPLSSLALGQALLPAWAWLVPLALLALAYPARAWRDAPWYPTPARALTGLAALAPLPAGARLLDAGCGLGHGLRALQRQYPQARLEGVEWSAGLQRLARLACRGAHVRRGDMWADDWGAFDLVYLFQRPESMARALAKAQREMRPGSWLVSLAFEVPGAAPTAVLQALAHRPAWLYRIGPAEPAAASSADVLLKSSRTRADMQNTPRHCNASATAAGAPRRRPPAHKKTSCSS